MEKHSLPGPWVRELVLQGDASHRRYARIWDRGGRSAIIARYPRAVRHQLARDLEVQSWCSARGLKVPTLLDHDLKGGWAIHEDFGSDDAEHALEEVRPNLRAKLCLRTLRPLIQLARLQPNDLPSWNPPLDGARLRWEVAGFEMWCVRHRLDVLPSRAVRDWLDDLTAATDEHPRRVCHRDFHLNNLFFLPDEEVGVIDYQDILIGPDTYDAVSLLGERSMPRMLSKDEIRRVRKEWAAATAAIPGWQERWRQVRIQRGLKVLGTFARLSAAGARAYERWIDSLAQELAADVAEAGAPSELVDLLLDLSRCRPPGIDRESDQPTSD